MSRLFKVNRVPRLLLTVLTIAVVVQFSARDVAFSAPKRPLVAAPNPLSVGDRAIWEFAGKQHEGTVESVDPRNGWVTLKLDDGEFGGKKIGPAAQLRKIPKDKPKARAAGGDDNPFETAEERADKSGPRNWSDQSGKFKIEATLVKFDNNVVTLKRKDGKEVTFPLEKLSDEDQEFLKGIISSSSSKDEGGKDEEDFPISNVDASQARPLDVSKTSKWAYEPDASAVQDFPDTRIALGRKAFFEKPVQIFVSPEKLKAVVVWLDEFQSKKARIQACDLKRDKLEKSGDFAPGQVPIAMSSDMSHVLAYKIAKEDRGVLFLYDVQGEKIKPRIAWKPHAKDGPNNQNILSARFVGKDHLLTVNTDGVHVLWNVVDKAEPIYQIVKASGKTPAFSASGKYCALIVDGGVVIVETLTGTKAGFVAVDDHLNGLVAFDPQGRQLALVVGGRVRVWDLTTHELTLDFNYRGWGHEQLVWTDENTLLVDSKLVIDVPHRVQIWSYTGTPLGILVGSRYLYVETDQNCVLAIGPVPNDEARGLVKALKPEDLLTIQPGHIVSLDVQLGGFQEHRDKVADGLKKRIEANGMQVADGSKLKLVVTVKPGEAKQVQYRTFGRGFATEKHSVTTQLTSVAYQINGKTVWDGGGEIFPRLLRMRKDESIDAAISRQISESIAGLGTTYIPKYVANLPAGTAPGTSKAP